MPELRRLAFAFALAVAMAPGAAAPSYATDARQAPASPSDRPPPAVRADIPRARAVLASVLDRREFGRSAMGEAASHLRQRISQWLLRLWERLTGRRVGERTLALIFAVIVALLALSVLAAWIVKAVLARPFQSRLDTLAPLPRKSSRAWVQEAIASADPREAARCLYNAVICRLEEEGAWRADVTRTPREYVRLLPAGHNRRQVVVEVAGLFEQLWYRARPAGTDDGRRVAAQLESLGWARSGRAI